MGLCSWQTRRKSGWMRTSNRSNLNLNLKEQGFDLNKIPYVLQLNKRDLPNALPAERLKKLLLVKGEPVYEAVAPKGVGVMETLKAVARQVLVELRKSA